MTENRKSDIIFITCPISFNYKLKVLGDQKYWPPPGILYLAAVLEKDGRRVSIIDPAVTEMSLENTLDRIADEKPLIVGLSTLTPGLRTCVQLAEGIRKRFGDSITLCIGGSHISADPDFFHRFPLFDIAVTGEGEITFRDIVRRLMGNEAVKGLFPGVPVQNLDDIPFPARHLVDIEKYTCYKNREVALTTSRGCPFDCIFCSRPAVSNKYRMRSAKNLIDEMALFYAEGWKGFYFLDDILTLNKKHVMAFCNEILARGLQVKWGSNTRADCVDEELIDKMAEAGCNALLFGVESGNPRIRNEVIGKGVSDEKIIAAIRMTNRKKIISGMFLMMGFPSEGLKEIEDTVRFAKRVKASVIGIHLTKPMPGAEIFRRGIEEGIIEGDIIDQYARGDLGEGFVEKWPVYVPVNMTRETLEKAKRKAMLLFYLRPAWILKNMKRYLLNYRLLVFDLKKAVSIIFRGQSKESMS
jgi:anaerobic magnesium-protoporphyrin IX monomethyl ester cyclase